MKRVVLLSMFGLLVSGCAVADLNRSKAQYDASLASYRSCLTAKGAAGCTNEKAILDADERAWQSKSAAFNGQTYTVGVR